MRYLSVIRYNCACANEECSGYTKRISFEVQDTDELKEIFERHKKRRSSSKECGKSHSKEGGICERSFPNEIIVFNPLFDEVLIFDREEEKKD